MKIRTSKKNYICDAVFNIMKTQNLNLRQANVCPKKIDKSQDASYTFLTCTCLANDKSSRNKILLLLFASSPNMLTYVGKWQDTTRLCFNQQKHVQVFIKQKYSCVRTIRSTKFSGQLRVLKIIKFQYFVTGFSGTRCTSLEGYTGQNVF